MRRSHELHTSVEHLNYVKYHWNCGAELVRSCSHFWGKKKKRRKILETGDFEDSTTIDPFFYTQVGSQFSIRVHYQNRSTAVETASLENRQPHCNSFNRIPLMTRSLTEAHHGHKHVARKVILFIRQNSFTAHQVNKSALQEVSKNTRTLTTPQEPSSKNGSSCWKQRILAN